MNKNVYLSENECYSDALYCLEANISNINDVIFVLKYYENEEHYECCNGIIKAINEYKNIIKVDENFGTRHKIL
jgi:hypothetical protein